MRSKRGEAGTDAPCMRNLWRERLECLAIYLRDSVPTMEYFFCDTGAELPETYDFLDRLEVVLGKRMSD